MPGPWEKFQLQTREQEPVAPVLRPWEKFTGGADISPEAAFMAAEGMGISETLATGTGRALDKAAMGLKQGALEGAKRALPGVWSDSARMELETLKADEGTKDAAYAGLQRARPTATGLGESIPLMAAPASVGVLPAAGIAAMIEGSKYGTPQERARRALSVGASTAAGGYVAKGLTGLIAPVTQKAAGESHQGALEALERIGGKPRLSEATGSPMLGRLEDMASRVPGGAGVMDDFTRSNQLAVNRAAAESIGQRADELSPSVFAKATQEAGEVFEEIKRLPGKVIKIDKKVGSVADDILRQQKKMIPSQQDAELIKLAQQAKMVSAHSGKMDGETYQLLRSGLSEASYEAAGTNKKLYGELLEAVDNSADASLRALGHDDLAIALRAVRPEYANLKLLQKGTVAEAGNVSPAKVAQAMRTQNPGAFRRGQFMGPLGDVAKVGEGLKPLRAGSPTFEREAVSNPLSMLANAAWSYPIAKMATSGLARAYPRTFGKTKAAQTTAQLVQPSARAAIAAELARSGLLPLPVMAEE